MAGGRCTDDRCNGGGVQNDVSVHMLGVYKRWECTKWWGCTYGGSVQNGGCTYGGSVQSEGVRNGRGQVYK